jgi:predicted O-linked N-acetylglucosamine transferase (SPINDLY family)
VESWLAEIAAARPDVIFYPEVGMDPSTCSLAALRLAPLQIAAWGHPITTGLPTIDWFLSAELLESPDASHHYREQLVRLPGTGVHTEFPQVQTQPWDGPEDDRLLARIAKEVGSAEFWLAAPGNMPWTAVRLRERLAAAFQAEGLDPQAYLRTMPWLPRSRFLSFLEAMDIYLDCPAFSGYTTAWQALHCGLPIITVEGQYLRQRLAAGLLRQVGATSGISLSREQYVATAVAWANESREATLWAARRDEIRRAAPRADGNRAPILAFEESLSNALSKA